MAWDPVAATVTMRQVTITLPKDRGVLALIQSRQQGLNTEEYSVAIAGDVQCQVDIIYSQDSKTPEQAKKALTWITKPALLESERLDTVGGDAVMDWISTYPMDHSHTLKRLTIHGNMLVQKSCISMQPIDFTYPGWTGLAVRYTGTP